MKIPRQHFRAKSKRDPLKNYKKNSFQNFSNMKNTWKTLERETAILK
jgi:preprotein translocase subunit SecA